MNKEFKKTTKANEVIYTLEAASAGATSSAAVATGPVGKKGNLLVQSKDDKPVVQKRNPVAANVNAAVGGGGAGAHKDKTKVIPRKEKHKKDFRKEIDEGWGMGAYSTVSAAAPISKHVPEDNVDPGYIDQENSMTSSSLKSLYNQAARLRDLIKKMGDDTTLEPWQQEKIAKASDYVNSVFRSLDDQYELGTVEEEKQKGVDGKACWKGYKRMGTKKKGGKTVDNCVKVNEEVDPDIHVPGFGMVSLERLKKHVKALSNDFNTWIQNDEFTKAAYRSEQFYNALMALAKALKQASAKLAEAEKKGLWANIHARKKKGLPSRKPGEKGAPSKKSWDTAVAASKKKKAVGEDNLKEYERYRYTDDDGNEWEVDDEGNKTLLNPSRHSGGYKSRYSKPYNPLPKKSSQPEVYYFYNVPDGAAMKAFDLGLKRTKSGKWYARSPIDSATKLFGNPKKWMPKTEEGMMPASHFAGTPKNKLGPAAHLKGKMKRPARQGDLVGGSAEESFEKKKILKKN